jgi:hypothetical protein
MWSYQIEILKNADPVKFAKKIKELKRNLEVALKKWKKNHTKIGALNNELVVYEENLRKARH